MSSFRARLTLTWLGVAVAAALGCRSTPEAAFVGGVAEALGGRRAIERCQSVLLEGDGESYYLGEGRTPGGDLPVFESRFREAFDWTGNRFRKEELRLPLFTTGTPGLRAVITALDQSVAFDVGTDKKARRVPEPVARARVAELYHHPIGLLRAMLLDGARVRLLGRRNGADTARVTLIDGTTLTLAVDPATRLPMSIASPIAHPILGDAVATTAFSDYQSVGGVLLPVRLTERIDDAVVASIHVRQQTVNIDRGGPLPPPQFNAFTADARLEAPAVLPPVTPKTVADTVDALAPGVWRVSADQYTSVLIEQSDHLILVEAPLDDAHTDALLATAKRLQPAKPVTDVIVSHHHFDHIGGVRAAVAAGLRLFVRGGGAHVEAVTAARSQNVPPFDAWLADLLTRPHTRVPDELSRAKRPPRIEPIAADRTLADPIRPVLLLPIDHSEYADSLLMVYLPRERALIEADVYTPPPSGARGDPWYPFAANLVENVRSRKLAVDRVVPLHGPVVPFSDLVEAARRPAPAPVS